MISALRSLQLPWRRRDARASTQFASSTLAELAWQRARNAAARWGVWGAVLGTLAALVAFAPATWLASAISAGTGQRLLLVEAQGTVWSGSALPVLTGGPGSRDASMLGARLHWRLRPALGGLRMLLTQACCLTREFELQIKPGLGRVTVVIPAQTGAVGQWPAAWLSGLGTPWNTLALGGQVRLATPGLTVEAVQGRLRLVGGVDFEVLNASSRLSTLDMLGSYRFSIRGPSDGAGDAPATLNLETLDGALRLTGSGQWTGQQVRFRGEARAAEGQEAALSNLLNIIGRRQGALSVISIG